MAPPVADGAFARWLAASAGDELLALREEMRFGDACEPNGDLSRDPEALRDAGDKRAHDALVSALGRWRTADAVLSEEGVRDDPERLSAQRVWIVDPLDGTREFGEPGRTDWAVHVALWQRGAGLSAGAIALPARYQAFGTDQPPAYPALREGPLRIAVSRSRAPELVTAVAQRVGADLVPMGSAGVKIAAVVTGEVDAYLHAGGQYEWDSAAPVAVARATGLHTSRIDGSTLVYNQADPRLPDLLVCRRDLADRLLTVIQEYA